MTAMLEPAARGRIFQPQGRQPGRSAAAGLPGTRPLPWGERLLDFLVPNILYVYARLWHRCRRCGPNPLPAHGPALVIANHPCHADAAFLMAGCRRWIHFLQARENYDIFFLRFFFRLFGCIPILRDRPDPRAMRAALTALRHGAVIGVFPEADITPDGGYALQPGKPGAGWLALRSRVPVVPAFIADRPPMRGTVADWVRPAHGVRVFFGPPVDLSAHYGEPITHDLLRAVTDRLMQGIALLRPPTSDAASTS
jgi:1-acyl-sn-glycerol-3-phosphate acyltransferase